MTQPTIERAAIDASLRAQFDVFVDEHRARLASTLDGLSEAEARVALVPSRTTLLGLVKHAVFVEKVWFDSALSGRTRAEIGIPETPDESFILEEADTVESVLADHAAACAASRAAVAGLALDHTFPGHRLGPLPLHWVYLHLLREYAQHLGHADILREQVLAKRHP